MMAKQTRTFPGMVRMARNTENDAVKYDRLVGGGTFTQRFGTEKVILSLESTKCNLLCKTYFRNFTVSIQRRLRTSAEALPCWISIYFCFCRIDPSVQSKRLYLSVTESPPAGLFPDITKTSNCLPSFVCSTEY